MIITPCYKELLDAKNAIDDLSVTKPKIYQQFMNLVQLTRQLQYGYQYMGSLIMNEDAEKFIPYGQSDYVLSLYQEEIENLKKDSRFKEFTQFLTRYKSVSYDNISKLALGANPKTLVGPIVVR